MLLTYQLLRLYNLSLVPSWRVVWIERLQVFDGFFLGFLSSSVVLGSRHRAGMTRQFLNGENVHPGFQEVRAKSSTKIMGRE